MEPRIKDTMDVEDVIFGACDEHIRQLINGGVYFEGDRPADSKLEDAVIAVSTATADQIADGRAKLNIYIQDIDNGKGRYVKNRGRLEQFKGTDVQVLKLLNDADKDYVWSLSSASAVLQSHDTREHFYNINLAFIAKNF